MIPFGEALSRLLGMAKPLGHERVSLLEADGRVLAEEIVAKTPLPPFDYSAMDGYAVRAADFAGEAPHTTRVVGESAAGSAPQVLAERAVMRIFTGAPMPEGADAVVPQEDTEREGDTLRVKETPRPRAFVRKRGDDLAEGAVALPRGARLHPGSLALAAALDHPQLNVVQRPVVMIVATGDELRAPGEAGRPGSIPESNGYFLAAAIRRAGGEPRVAPFVRDNLAHATEAIEAALRSADVVVTIGGVSVGDHDVVRQALENAGVHLDFWRVAIKPGKPLAVGHVGSKYVLGLPGNPASASLTFLLFGVPLLRALGGDAKPLPARTWARFDGHLQRRAGREELLRARLVTRDDELWATPFPNQASGAVTSFAEAETLAVVPAHRERLERGERVEVIAIRDIFA